MISSVEYLDGDKEKREGFTRPGKVIVYFQNGDVFEGTYVQAGSSRGLYREGYGKYKFHSGARYEGDYHKNLKHGLGIYHYVGGDKYDGEWEHGLKNGKGTYTYTNGDVFYGIWVDDKRQGKGKFVYASTGVTLDGVWSEGELVEDSWKMNMKTKKKPKKLKIPDTDKKAIISSKRPLGVIISGAPASGKGTQCERIVNEFGLVHLSTGDMLRAAVAMDSDVGRKADECMKAGKLVPDEVVISAVQERLSQDDVMKNGFLLDGFPRTPEQAKALSEMGIKVDLFVLLNVPDEVLIERVVGRRLDPVTRKIYHVKFNPPPEDIMDRLEIRSDDSEEKAVVRLNVYHRNINSIKNHYKLQFVGVDGSQPVNDVWTKVKGAISVLRKPLGIIISGPPASGKGTQCENIKEGYGVIHLSTGDMLRAAAKAGTEVGKIAEEIMAKGGLVPDDVMIKIITERLNQDDIKKKGFLLDGFPRTAAQAEALIDMGIEIDICLFLEVPDEELVERVVGRRLDPDTGAIYHMKYKPPPAEIAGRVVQRKDDNEETAKTRIEKYRKVESYLKSAFGDVAQEIEGNIPPAEVWKLTDAALAECK